MYIKVRVIPESKEESVVKKTNDHYIVSVREKAEFNLANRRVVELIAREYLTVPAKVRIISGHHSRSKILSIDNPAIAS